MPVGIERIGLYAGQFATDSVAIAVARGRNRDDIMNQVMVEERSVIPPYEDVVTLAVNACKTILSSEDLASIELLIVGTESGVDDSKPISSWVHRFCGLPANCRSFDLKHACYSGTAALKMAAAWVRLGIHPGKKALVVCADYSRPCLVEFGYDFVGGGCAVALLVGAEPKILEFELSRAGYWTDEVADVFRPTSRLEIGDNQVSLYSYLDALDGAFDHYEEAVGGRVDYESAFKKHIYHAPFPGMTLHAHKTMLGRWAKHDDRYVEDSFRRKVACGLLFARRLGSCYGASNFVCLLGLLETCSDLAGGDRLSVFSYGSGCHGEFYDAVVGSDAVRAARSLEIDAYLAKRRRLSLKEYEAVETARRESTDLPDYQPRPGLLDLEFGELYEGKGLLVLDRVERFQRHYRWS
jgi:hydroxymethylglutaryl-CoA synthase